MTTKLEIINNAFIQLGDDQVTTFDTSNPVVAAFSRIYDRVKDKTLSLHPWSFALKWKELLQQDLKPDDPRYQYCYHLPADYIQFWQSYPGLVDYQINRDKVYANIGSAFKWQYTADVPEGIFPGYFTDAIISAVAAKGALLKTENPNLSSIISQQAEKDLAIAMNRDATQSPSVQIQDMPMWTRHFTG